MWDCFSVICRLLVAPLFIGFGIFIGLFLGVVYLAIFPLALIFNIFAFFLAAIANDRNWRDETLPEFFREAVPECVKVVCGFLLAPASVIIWAFAPLSSKKGVRLYWID